MKTKALALLPMIAVSQLSNFATAEEVDKWTLSTSIGVDKSFDGTIGTGAASPEAEYDYSRFANITLGRDLYPVTGGVLRGELEGFYRKSDLDSVSGFANAAGEMKQYGLATNLVYEMSDIEFPIKPYVGVGIGYASTGAEFRGIGRQNIDDRTSTLLRQAFGGMRYTVSDKIDLFADLRYSDAKDPRFNVGKSKATTEHDTLTTAIGVRYRFGH